MFHVYLVSCLCQNIHFLNRVDPNQMASKQFQLVYVVVQVSFDLILWLTLKTDFHKISLMSHEISKWASSQDNLILLKEHLHSLIENDNIQIFNILTLVSVAVQDLSFGCKPWWY